MTRARSVDSTLVWVGLITGAVTVITYLAKTFLPLPPGLERAFFVYRGPLMVAAFMGIYPFLSRPFPSAAAMLGTVFGIISGAASMIFAVVQEANVHDIHRYIQAAEDPATQELWRNILRGVFTVQGGINYVFDFFADCAGLLYAIVLWRHPKFGKGFTLLAVLMIGPHFVMKIATFPTPPAAAGLFDAGPLAMLFFGVVLFQMARHVGWMNEWVPTPTSSPAVAPSSAAAEQREASTGR